MWCAGNYWAIHPACVDSFARGDYRRRHARRRAVASKTGSTAPSAHSGSLAISGTDAAEYTTFGQVTTLNFYLTVAILSLCVVCRRRISVRK